MEEIWKDIGIKKYAVSNMGNVRGADGITLMKPLDQNGYKRVGIYNDGILKYRRVHHLVMEAFVGERPIGYDTDHINRIKNDNRLENLRYCSKSENMLNRCNTRTDIEETDPLLRKKIIQTEWKKKYYEDNKEKVKEKVKQNYEDNKERYKEYQKLYNQENKEKILEGAKKYREQNKEKRAEYQRNYRQKQKEAKL